MIGAGKGDTIRPFSPTAWKKNYGAIDFSVRREGAPPPGSFAPKKEQALEYLECSAPDQMVLRAVWHLRRKSDGDTIRYHGRDGLPVAAYHVRLAPSVRAWAWNDEIEISDKPFNGPESES